MAHPDEQAEAVDALAFEHAAVGVVVDELCEGFPIGDVGAPPNCSVIAVWKGFSSWKSCSGHWLPWGHIADSGMVRRRLSISTALGEPISLWNLVGACSK